jgi:hypothetical protein
MLLSFFTCYILATICHWLSFLAIGK